MKYLEQNRLLPTDKLKKYKANVYLFRKQELARDFYLIISGTIKVDHEKNLAEAGTEYTSGSILGDIAFLNKAPHTYSAQTTSDSLLLVLNDNVFETTLKEYPALANLIIKSLARRLHQHKITDPEEATIKKAKTNTDPQSKSNKPQQQSQKLKSLFPPRHQQYDLSVPPQHHHFLYLKEIACPVCKKTFTTRVQRTSRLILQKIGYDFRRHYKSFNPYLYSIWACPHCLYANFYQDFRKITSAKTKKIENNLKIIAEAVDISYKEPFAIDDAFTYHYLALFTENKLEDSPQKKGNIWLRLMWLYQDVNDLKMSNFAADKSLNCFIAVFTNPKPLAIQKQQRLALLIAELYIKKQDYNTALQFFHHGIDFKKGNPVLNQQAQDRIQDLKKL